MRTIEEVMDEVNRRIGRLEASPSGRGQYFQALTSFRQIRDFILSGGDPYPWGPAPTAEEATAHAARPGCGMGLWLRRYRGPDALMPSDPTVAHVWVNTVNGKVQQVPHTNRTFDSFEYRPIDNNGALVSRPTVTT